MKKTKKTMLTSALLSAAVALQSESLVMTPKVDASAPVYGPPPSSKVMFGDLNQDKKTDILDFVLMKSAIANNEHTDITLDRSDLDQNGIVTPEDLKAFQKYLFGKIPDVQHVYPDDYDDNPETVVTEPAVTTTPPETAYQTKYGPPPTSWASEMQGVYGPPPAYSSYDEPEITDTPEVTTAPSVTDNTDELFPLPNTEAQCVYGPPSYFETLRDSEVD